MSELVYILAASHSGSTLLAMLLNAHPDVISVGELAPGSFGDVSRYRCSCQRLLLECPFWNGVCQAMARRGVAFNLSEFDTHFRADSPWVERLLRPLHRGPLIEMIRDVALHLSSTWRRRLPEVQRRNAVLVKSLLEVTGKKIVLDSSKIGLRLKYLLRNPELHVKVIRLIRDGRAVALTYTDPARLADASDPKFRGGGCGGSRANEKLSITEAAREWRRSNEEAECILAGLDRSRWTEVRYEDVCANPSAVLDRVFGFLEVDPFRKAQEFRSLDHHVIGNGMRLDSSPQVRLDERWRSILCKQDLDTFDQVAGHVNRRYGYK